MREIYDSNAEVDLAGVRAAAATKRGRARGRRLRAALLAAIALIVFVAGCGGSGSPNLADEQMAVQLGSRIVASQSELASARRLLAAVRDGRATIQGHAEIPQRHAATQTVTATVTSGARPLEGVLVTFTVTGANAGASGTCVPVDCRSDHNGVVTFTYAVRVVGDDTITVVCAPTTPPVTVVTRNSTPPPVTTPTTPTTTPPGPPKIFQVELRNCKNLHVGYRSFPAGATVHWSVTRKERVVSAGAFVAAGGDDAYHFVTQPLGIRLPGAPDAAAHFTWMANGVASSHDAMRAPGC